MRLRSHVCRSFLAGTIVLLFLLLSFNAYACVLPLFGVPQAAMGAGCADPQDQPARQFCDAFKTLGIHNSAHSFAAMDYQTSFPVDTASLGLFSDRTPQSSDRYCHPENGPPQDLLLKISVLRI